jgi:hypothetical protein
MRIDTYISIYRMTITNTNTNTVKYIIIALFLNKEVYCVEQKIFFVLEKCFYYVFYGTIHTILESQVYILEAVAHCHYSAKFYEYIQRYIHHKLCWRAFFFFNYKY